MPNAKQLEINPVSLHHFNALRRARREPAPLLWHGLPTMPLAREAGHDLDIRRFRPNLVIDTKAAQPPHPSPSPPGGEGGVRGEPFEEDRWVGKILEFGPAGTGRHGDSRTRDSLLASPAISVTMRDKRCVIINLDPDTAEANPDVMKTVIRMNENHAGVYGTVVRTGELRVGQAVGLRA